MPPFNRLESKNSRSQPNSGYAPRFESTLYTRIDNGLFLVNDGSGKLDVQWAKDIHRRDAYALTHEYERAYLPHGLRLYTMQAMRHIYYTVTHNNIEVFRAVYQLDTDELTNVRTNPHYRNKGIARAVLSILLRTDGPKLIRVGPSPDSPVGLIRLIRFYSSFPGYYHVPGTNEVVRLMDMNTKIEEAGEYASDFATEEAAATDFGRREKSGLELSVLEQNSREYKRIMAIIQPMNDAEVEGLLKAQQTDMLSLQTAMKIYDESFFAGRPWGRHHRVTFAQGMANLLAKQGMKNGLWDRIVREESF